MISLVMCLSLPRSAVRTSQLDVAEVPVAVVANVVAVMPAATSAMLVAIAAYPDAPLKNAAPPAPQRIAVPALLPHVVPPVLLVGALRRLAAPALLPHVVRPVLLLGAPRRLAAPALLVALVLLDAPLVTQLL